MMFHVRLSCIQPNKRTQTDELASEPTARAHMLPVLPLCIRREAHHRWRKRDQQGCSTVQYIDVRHWPLRGGCRTLGFPDASYRNNADNSSQRAHAIFIAEDRQVPDAKAKTKPDGNCRGAIVDYESHKVTTTTQSTTVAELAALSKCFGTCLFLRGLWADIAGEVIPIHITL